MALLRPRLVTVSCFGTLVKRTCSRGDQYRQVLQKAFSESSVDLPSAAALSRSYKKAYNTHSKTAPNFGSGTPGGSRVWWNDVMRSTVIEAGAPTLAYTPNFDWACDNLYNNLHKQWELFPTTMPALRNLRSWCDQNDCQLGVVANFDDRLDSFLHEFAGIRDKFDFTLSSYECGFEQPHKYIYYNALHMASVPASAFANAASAPALHCGHLALDDLHGALGAGFAGLLVNTKFDTLSPLRQMITEWQETANAATRAWHTPHLGLTMDLLAK